MAAALPWLTPLARPRCCERGALQLAVVGPEAVRVMEVAINEISRRIGDNVQEWTQAYVAASERVRRASKSCLAPCRAGLTKGSVI